MTASWDPKLGQLTYGKDAFGETIVDPSNKAGGVQPEEDPFADIRRTDETDVEYQMRISNKRRQLEAEKAAAERAYKDKDKPFISPKFLTDVPKAAANFFPAFATDVVDIGLLGADLATETGRAVTDSDYDFNWRNIGDDSDNPLTQWRRNTFTPGGFDTQAGEMTNLVLRLGGDIVGFKWLFKAPVFVNNLRKLGKIIGLLDKAGDTAKTLSTVQRTTNRLQAIEKTATKASKIRQAASVARKNDYLSGTFETISRLDQAEDITGWWKNAVNSARAYTKSKIAPKTLAETIAWDAFAAFNVMGEGDDLMDETIFDFASEMGVPLPDMLTSDPLDMSIWRKAKGILDASFVGIIGGGIVDLIRIKRFQGAIKQASPAQRKLLVNAFEDSADEMGRGIAGLLPPAKPGGPSAVDDAASEFIGRVRKEREGISEFERIQADAVARTQRAQTTFQLDGAEPRNLVPQTPQLSGSEPPAGLLPDGSPAGLLPGSDMPNPFPEGQGFIASGSRVRAAEPTITPMGIRQFSREMLAAGYTPQQVQKAIVDVMPRKRVDLIEYIEQGVTIGEEGIINASDSVWSNYITNLGLSEGWAKIDPQTAEVRFVRSAALAADQSALVTTQAKALDELNFLQRQRLQAEQMRGNRLQPFGEQPADVPVDVNQAGELADAEAVRARGIEADEALARSGLDPAVNNAEVDAVNAGLNADALAAEDIARYADEVTSTDPDGQVRELLGLDPDAIEVTVEKAPSGRGWVVIDPSGEQVGEQFATKRAATRKADAEKKRLRADMQKRAQQVADDESGSVFDVSAYDPARDSDLTASVKLTKPQINELIKYPNFRPIFDQFGVSKKTYEFTQGDLSDFIDGARAMIASGVDGRRARMLKTLIDKFETPVKLLEPEVRRQRTIDSMLAETKQFTDHGDYC